MCDYATKYPEAIQLKNIDAEHIAEKMIKVFSRVGVPREILTDQGSNFVSQLLAELYKLLQVKPIRTSPYHPQTNGLVERFNKTVKAMVRKTVSEDGKDWDKMIPSYLLFTNREVPQSSTGFSPFELLYSWDVRGPLDILKETWESDQKSDESVVSYVMSMQQKLKEMAKCVKENMLEKQDEQKRWYDVKARLREFNAGDPVLVLLPTSTNKLLAQWQGLYQVLERMGRVTYLVDMYDKKKRQRVFHINMLKAFSVRTSSEICSYTEEDVSEQDDISVWNEASTKKAEFGDELSGPECGKLDKLLECYQTVFSDTPGLTRLAEHRIPTMDNNAVRLPPYRLPHAYRELVRTELDEM